MLDENESAAPVAAGRGAKIAMDNNSGGEDSATGAASGNHVMPRLISHRRVHDALPELPHVAAPDEALAEMNKIFATAMLTDGERCRPVVLQNYEQYASRSAVTLRVRAIRPRDFLNMLLPLLVRLEERATGTRTARVAAWWRKHPRRRHVGEVTAEEIALASTVEQLIERRRKGSWI